MEIVREKAWLRMVRGMNAGPSCGALIGEEMALWWTEMEYIALPSAT